MQGTGDALQHLGDIEERSRQFAAYWLSLPKVDLVPMRSAFEPDRVPRLLRYIVIHELVSPELIRLRLVGSSVVEEYGQEITGRNYLDFVDEDRRSKASRAIYQICERPAGMLVQLRTVTRAGRAMTRESIGFPIRDDDGTANLVYFCSSPARERDYTTDPADELQVIGVMRRVYIDVGAGVPELPD